VSSQDPDKQNNQPAETGKPAEETPASDGQKAGHVARADNGSVPEAKAKASPAHEPAPAVAPQPARVTEEAKKPVEMPSDPAGASNSSAPDSPDNEPAAESESGTADPQDQAVVVVPADPLRPVRIWLWLLAAMVFAMVVVGGATRLTEAGLSITEWKPLTGVIPPLSDAVWNKTFNKYKQIPQFKEMFSTMTLAQYKVIYFWEWGHRLLGRLIGLVFVLPFLWFVYTRRIGWNLGWKLVLVLALGAIQGAIGWWMVKSGLAGRTEVAAERLAVHLLLASVTFVALIWLAMGLRGREPDEARWDVRGEATGLIAVILIQIGLGALVAGARAGLTYNTWPLMDGHLVPSIGKLTSMKPFWLNFLENPTMLQFQHRMFAYLVVLMVLAHAYKTWQNRVGGRIAGRAWALSLLVLLQAALGVFTLLHVLPAGKMPIYLALAHQAVAFLLLGMAVVHRAAMARPGSTGANRPAAAAGHKVQADTGDTAIAT